MNKRKPGRPRIAEPRRNRITSSYTDAELAILERAAGGLRVSEYVRARSLA